MQVQNTTLIQQRIKDVGELNDGFQAFCSQGAHCIEMVAYRGTEINTAGCEVGYDLYEITIHVASEDLDLTELSQFTNRLDKFYTVQVLEYYETAQEAHARIGMLIAELNHF